MIINFSITYQINSINNLQIDVEGAEYEILKSIDFKKINIKSKIDLLKNINRYVDHLIIRETKSIENSTSKDMLFEFSVNIGIIL